MQLIAGKEATVERVSTTAVPLQGGTHKFTRLAIEGISLDDPEVTLSPGELGINRLINLRPQPVGEHFSVVWNGDAVAPKLRFDGWVGDRVEVIVEAWGFGR